MKVFMAILLLVSLTLAEPPVGDGYPAARSSHDDQQNEFASDNQRSISQEYGPPNLASTHAREPSNEQNALNARSALNVRGRSKNFAAPKVRVSFNQRFTSAAARNSPRVHNNPKEEANSQEHALPNARSAVSQEHGHLATGRSQKFDDTPSVSSRTLSAMYGVPDNRNSPSQEYGAPVAAARNNQKSQPPASNFRSAQPSRISKNSQDYSTSAARSQFQTDSKTHGYTAMSGRSNEGQGYDATKPFAKSSIDSRNAPSSAHSAPSSRSQSSSQGISSGNNKGYESVSQAFTPNQSDFSENHDVVNARGLSQEYGVPSSRASKITDAVSSSASTRSSPSSTYLPTSRNAMPSQHYGVPEQRDAGSQGYDNARARALEELQNQEPANYDFAYQIEDQESGTDFGHTETREENRAQGSYFVVRPDGTKQTVEYEADERGFKPRISVEPAAGGYDENSAELARSAEGPY